MPPAFVEARAGRKDQPALKAAHDAPDPIERTRQARALLEFLAQAAHDPAGLWAKMLREEADLLREKGDYYLFHEHLKDENHAVYFHQFVEHARAHGLQYLAEAQMHTTLSIFPPEVQETLRKAMSMGAATSVSLEISKDSTDGRSRVSVFMVVLSGV